MQLRELQRELQHDLLGGDSNISAAIVDAPPLPADARLAIYRNAYRVRLIDALDQRLAEPPHTTLEAWRARDALRGREVTWAQGHGRADGIDGEGRLVVALEDGGRTTLGAGEVHLQRIG